MGGFVHQVLVLQSTCRRANVFSGFWRTVVVWILVVPSAIYAGKEKSPIVNGGAFFFVYHAKIMVTLVEYDGEGSKNDTASFRRIEGTRKDFVLWTGGTKAFTWLSLIIISHKIFIGPVV